MKNALIFLGGAAVGGLAATLYFKRKMVILEEDYQRITNDEINKYINQPIWVKDVVVETTDCLGEKQNIVDYVDYLGNDVVPLSIGGKNLIDIEKCKVISEENGYVEAEEENTYEEDDEVQVAPYIITPDEYGDDEYTTRTLTAFTDKVVLDENNCLFDTNYFGKDIMKTLYSKKNIDASIFVRDDNEKVDYEIIKEKISFEDFTKLTDSEDK